MAIVYGTNNTETLNAADGVTQTADTIYGYGGGDTILGLGGNDFIIGGAGGDAIDGGDDIDAAFYTDSNEGVTVSLLTGKGSGGTAQGDTLTNVENLYGSAYDDTLFGNNGSNSLSGMQGHDILKGFGGADSLSGGNGNDMLYGMDSDDTLYGGLGDDTLHGGTGADWMAGGSGNDTYYVDTYTEMFFDVVTESAGQGVDRVRTSVSYELPDGADIEILETTDADGTAMMWLLGNSSGNHIIGNDGTNVLSGNGGNDTLEGRGGDDVYFVEEDGVTIIESAGQGNDGVLTAMLSYTLPEGADIEMLDTYFTEAPVELTGNSSGNLITGNAGNNVLNGAGGDDELVGDLGQDTFVFNTALDEDFNVDVLSDFTAADDTIQLDDMIFGAFATGPLADDRFVVGTAAQDANDNIIYDIDSGALFYDSDGTGGAAAIQFATVSAGLALTHLDFLIV
jgi:Ca2+-binding RTX toxin-like protein